MVVLKASEEGYVKQGSIISIMVGQDGRSALLVSLPTFLTSNYNELSHSQRKATRGAVMLPPLGSAKVTVSPGCRGAAG